MRTWTGQSAWKKWSGRLAIAEEDDFERAVLPLLRLLWPTMQQAPRKKSWDARGIDLFVWADTGPFPCAVQCKGFKVQVLGADQIRQIEKSIRTFIESDCVTDTYLVVHNRDGRNPELESRVQPLLEQVVAHGKAREAHLWGRQTVVNTSFARMEQLVSLALRDRSESLAEQLAGLFRFGRGYVERVPVVRQEITFRRDTRWAATALSAPHLADVPHEIEQASGVRWTLLTGHFGVGKSTAAVRAATHSTRPTLLIPCATVPAEVLTGGETNKLTQHVFDSLRLFDDEQHRLVRGIGGAVLAYLLRHRDSPFIVVLDGLDEHHVFATLNGLQRLSNQLAEFACPVVLTTRREHLDTLLGDFNLAFAELGRQFGRDRTTNVLQLELWGDAQTLSMVSQAFDIADLQEQAGLHAVRQAIESGTAQAYYGDLLRHPLFLQFILEDAAVAGVRRRSRPELIGGWIERKMRRDRRSWVNDAVESRATVEATGDVEIFVEEMLLAMEEIAFEMCTSADGQRVLLETIAGTDVVRIVSTHFPEARVTLLPVVLNSVLVTAPRTDTSVRVTFALRIFHEYLLARYLIRNGLDPKPFPEPVQVIAREILSNHEGPHKLGYDERPIN